MKLADAIFELGLVLTSFGVTVNSNSFSENDIPEWNYLDTSVDPCDNFYAFTCGNFASVHSRPPNLQIIDQFALLEDRLIEIGQEILSSSKNPDDPIAVKKAKAAYTACLNVEVYNQNSVPELRTVQEFGGMPLLSTSNESVEFSWNEIGTMVAKYGVPLIFSVTVGQTSQTESMIRISADPLANPTLFRPRLVKTYEEVLEEGFEEHAKTRETRSASRGLAPFDVFLQTIAKILLKNTNPEKPDEEVLTDLDDMATFMRQLYAGGIQDPDVISLPTLVTLGQLQTWTDIQFGGKIKLNWLEYLNSVFQLSGVRLTHDVQIMIPSAQWLYGIINLVEQTDPAIVKNFALLRVFLFQAPDSDSATREAFTNYYTAKGYQLYPRQEYCARKILDVVDTASLSYAVTHTYDRYHFNVNKIPKANELVQNIRNAFLDILTQSEWMDAKSREAALQKAQNMLVLLAHPDFVVNKNALDAFYENFRICEYDNYDNARTIRAFRQAYQFTQINPDRLFWGKSTFDANAYYNRPNNKIVIPISMLNPVFFYGDNPVLDYGRLGSIIGHEITHGFDNSGKNYDQDGITNPWWTSDTIANFNDKTTCFKEQYSQYYVPEINAYVNGSYCINENLADNGGIRESYKAFKKVALETGLQATGQYSLEQLFFIAYGTMWCSNESTYALQVILSNTNGYPPNRYRVIGSLSNMEEFAHAFGCPAGSKMNPETKCQLWG